MAVTATRTDAKQLFPLLDPDWEELDVDQLSQLHGIAFAVIEKAFEMAAAKAKFAVVGQIYWTEKDLSVRSSDPRAEKVCLGVFPTAAKAEAAADSLIGTPNSKELLRVWSLPIWKESPAQWRKARKAAMEAADLVASGGTQASKLSALMATQGPPGGYCEGVAPNEEGEFLPCKRPKGHPGSCTAKMEQT